ncbi:MAG: ADP-ribosylglycohydrolase family protein [Lentisphaeria bacterium]|nr:ADP-ribosylglycohydrolase family protein [Lentisphaeria bacterium]
MDAALFRKKAMGCWLGKAVGGTLGQPWEGSRGPLKLTFYDPMTSGMMPNDDLDLQVLWACRLNTDWNGVISRENFEKAWLENIRFPFDEYAVAIRNLKMGIHAPFSGSYDNWFRDGLGAAIRSEIWACLAPGEPELAAEYAYEDACVDHSGDGIYAEQFLAALESKAFVESDLKRLIEAGLSVIPSDCILAHAIRDTCRWCEIQPDFLAVRSKIMEYYGSANFTDVKMNLAFEIAALLLGNGDFGKTVCLAANAGQDADCTAATVGAILGIRDPESIPAEWLAPIGRSLLVSKEIVGIDPPASLDEFTDLIISLKDRISLKKTESVPFEAKRYEIPCKVSYFHPWFAADFRRFQPKPAENEETVLLPGNLIELDFTDHPVESLRIMRMEFRLEHQQLVKVMVNTPANMQVWVDGKFCFGRECGPMVPAFHRALQNQICSLDLEAGLHTLMIGVAPANEQMKKAEMLFGISDSDNFWLDNAFRIDS